VDLDRRTIEFARTGRTKRAYIGFFSNRTAEWLRRVYLPYREEFVERYGIALKNLGLGEYLDRWRVKLISFKESTVRAEIYRASERVLGRG